MRDLRFNWQIWTGFLLSVIALMSYPLVFVEWPLTRDFPWVNLLLFALAAAVLFVGVRKAFAPGRRWLSKVGAVGATTLSALVFSVFILTAFIAATWMPASAAAPKVGERAPEFSLADTTGRQMPLSELLTKPLDSSAATATQPRAVLLIFYRGHW